MMDLAIVEELRNAGLIRKRSIREAFYSSATGYDGDTRTGGNESTSVDTGFAFAAPMQGRIEDPDNDKPNQLKSKDVKELFEVCHNALKSSRAALSLCMKIQGNRTVEQNRAAFAEMIKRIESDMDYMSKVINDPELMKAQGDENVKTSPMNTDAAQNGQQQATNQSHGGNAQGGAQGGGGGGGEAEG